MTRRYKRGADAGAHCLGLVFCRSGRIRNLCSIDWYVLLLISAFRTSDVTILLSRRGSARILIAVHLWVHRFGRVADNIASAVTVYHLAVLVVILAEYYY